MNRAELEALSRGPYDEFISRFVSSRYEYFGVVLLRSDDKGDRLGHRMIASGHQGRVRFQMPDIVDPIQETGAEGIVLVHNHPSYRELRPSQLDLRVTEKIDDFISEYGARVIDHEIYDGNGDCYSFVENKVGRWGWECLEFDDDMTDSMRQRVTHD